MSIKRDLILLFLPFLYIKERELPRSIKNIEAKINEDNITKNEMAVYANYWSIKGNQANIFFRYTIAFYYFIQITINTFKFFIKIYKNILKKNK